MRFKCFWSYIFDENVQYYKMWIFFYDPIIFFVFFFNTNSHTGAPPTVYQVKMNMFKNDLGLPYTG